MKDLLTTYKETITTNEYKYEVELTLPNGVKFGFKESITLDFIKKYNKEKIIASLIKGVCKRLIIEIERDNSLLSTIETK